MCGARARYRGDNVDPWSGPWASGTTTGTDVGWYELSTVEVFFDDYDAARQLRVSIHEDVSGSPAAQALCVGHGDRADKDPGIAFFRDEPPAAGTTYWAVFEELSGLQKHSLSAVQSSDEVSRSWALSNNPLQRNSFSTGGGSWATTTLRPLEMEIGASLVTERVLVGSYGLGESDPDTFLRFGQERVTTPTNGKPGKAMLNTLAVHYGDRIASHIR